MSTPKRTMNPNNLRTSPSNAEFVRLVATRELTTRLRDRTFIVSTVVLLVIVAVSIALPLLLNRNADKPEFTVAVVGTQAGAVGEVAKAAGAAAIAAEDAQSESEGSPTEPGPALRAGQTAVPAAKLTVVQAKSVADADRRVESGSADAALVSGADGRLGVVGDSDVDSDLARLISIAAQSQQLTSALQQAGVSDADVARLLNAEPPQQRLLDPEPPERGTSLLLAAAFAALFFITSFAFGMPIAQSVVEEKQSRIVELLVAAVPVRMLLAGKVLGNTALAMAQVVLLIAVGLAAASATGQSAAVTLLLHSGGWFLLFFALGFTMLACLWAAAGALSARQEDLQSTTTPIQALVFAPFLLSFYVTDPGPWMTLLSYIPFTSPLSMPRRLLLGDAAWWEPLVAAGIIALTAAVLIALAARLYRGALLKTSARTSLRSAWSGASTSAIGS